jgi:hypothetical protein
MGISALLVAHVVLTTAGYVAFIATNVIVLVLCRAQQPAVVIAAVATWQRAARIFGPLLGIGILLGLSLAFEMHVPFASPWLVATYALIVLALGTQAAFMIPWQRQAERIAVQGAYVATRSIIIVLWVFTIVYVLIVALMFVHPV